MVAADAPFLARGQLLRCRVKIELNETNAKGYDDDALDLLKAFAVDKGPDIFVLAH